jgi:hypothetical protein
MERIYGIQIGFRSAVTLILLISSTLQVFAVPRWYEKFKKVRIFESTRAEVESLFGNPKIEYTFAGEWSTNVDYKLKEGELTVYYSTGRCSVMKKDGYDVDKNMVIGLDIKLEDEVGISDLGIEISQFDRREIHDLPGSFSYFNEKQGIMMGGTSKTISRIDREPTEVQEKLRCVSPK